MTLSGRAGHQVSKHVLQQPFLHPRLIHKSACDVTSLQMQNNPSWNLACAHLENMVCREVRVPYGEGVRHHLQLGLLHERAPRLIQAMQPCKPTLCSCSIDDSPNPQLKASEGSHRRTVSILQAGDADFRGHKGPLLSTKSSEANTYSPGQEGKRACSFLRLCAWQYSG